MTATIVASAASRDELGASRWIVSAAVARSGAGHAMVAAVDSDGRVTEIAVEVGDIAAREITITIDGEHVDATDDQAQLSHILSLATADSLRSGEVGYELCAAELARFTAAAYWWAATAAALMGCWITDLGCETAYRANEAAAYELLHANLALQSCQGG